MPDIANNMKMLQNLRQVVLNLTVISSVASGYTPTIDDPSAPNAQAVCPGYKAQSMSSHANGLTATLSLAGPACNAYGNDIDTLKLTVEYQDVHRLEVKIEPMHMVS